LTDQGERRVLSSGWHLWSVGLAWAPSGREIWFTGTKGRQGAALHAVDLSGRERLVAKVPGALQLLDIFRDGRALLADVRQRLGLACLPPGAGHERDLSWRDYSFLGDLAPDGRTIAFLELLEAGGASLFLRATDGSAAVHFADGLRLEVALSPDGQWVLAVSSPAPQIVLLPTGPGAARRLPRGEIQEFNSSRWLPDGSGVVFLGDEAGKGTSLYVQDVASGAIRRIASVDGGLAVAPDGRSVAAVRDDGTLALYAIDGGGSRRVAEGFEGNLIGWSSVGRFLYSYRVDDLPGKIYRTEIQTGARTVWKELMPADPAGIWRIHPVRITPDGRSYAYTYVRQLGDLYVYEGLR
jgi:dipeptidyl aminopeptidase/acylaminoacyl peptidase